jgi:hypothetical protein
MRKDGTEIPPCWHNPRAYAMPKDADILAFLLQLNQSCAAKEAVGEKITPPGLPLPVEEHEKFVTSDCIAVEL